MAQTAPWPNKPIRIIVAFAPGGLTDSYARLYAEQLTAKFGIQAIVENKPGAGAIIAIDAVAKSPADGYTLLMTTSGTVWQNRVLYSKLPYDPSADFAGVSMLAASPLVMVVPASLPVTNVKEFVELAATARQGDSGGPILNERGELAGVLFGQSDGRTIGSCSSRVRTFLASVGSKGFTAMPLAEFSNTPALDRGIGTSTQQSPVRFATAPLDQPQQRSMHVGGMPSTQQSPSESTTAFSNPPLPTGQFPASDGSLTFAHSYLNPSATLAEMLDIFTNGRSMLIAIGGMAMAILGLRTIFGGRR